MCASGWRTRPSVRCAPTSSGCRPRGSSSSARAPRWRPSTTCVKRRSGAYEARGFPGAGAARRPVGIRLRLAHVVARVLIHATEPVPGLRLPPRPLHPVDALPRHAPQAGPGGRPVPRRLVLGHGLPRRCRARARGAHSPLEPGNAAPGLRTAAGPRALARRTAGARSGVPGRPRASILCARARRARPRAAGRAGHRDPRPLRGLHPEHARPYAPRRRARSSSGASTARGPCSARESDSMNLWPARLHHLRRDSPQPERLAKFYGELLGDRVERLGEDAWLVAGRHRRLVIGRGTAGAVPYFALQMQAAAHLRAYAREIEQRGLRREASPMPLFADGACTVEDPDGRRIVFGLPEETCGESGLPARLQHFVCATSRLPAMVKFYGDLGMIESDRVLENDSLAARSEEHTSELQSQSNLVCRLL